MLDFNGYQRELQRRKVPENLAYLFTLQYEVIIEQQKQIDMLATLMGELTNSVQGFVNMREEDQRKFMEIGKRIGGFGRTDGVEVESVGYDPDPPNKKN